MSSEDNPHILYLAIKRAGRNGFVRRISAANTLADLRAALGRNDNQEFGRNASSSGEVAESKPPTLKSVLNRVVDTIHSQAELLRTVRIMGPVAAMAEMTKHVVEPLEGIGRVVENIDGVPVYGLTLETYRTITPGLERVKRLNRGLEALPAALLMSIVATFDSSMSDAVRAIYPQTQAGGPERQQQNYPCK